MGCLSSTMTISEILGRVRSRCTPTTWQAYSRDVGHFSDWCACRELDPLLASSDDIRQWTCDMQADGIAVSTVRRRLVAVHQLFLEAERVGVIELAPTHAVKRPPINSSAPRLSMAAARKLLAAAQETGDPVNLTLARLTILHRLRAREAASLAAEDVDLVAGTLRLPRSIVPLTTGTMQVLAPMCKWAGCGPLFRTRSGKPMTRWDVWRRMHVLGRLANVEVRSLTLEADAGELELHLT